MTSVDEAIAADGQMAAGLAAGLTTLDLNQVVRFTKYVRVVLPLDGFVFWVRADIVSPGALYNAARYNTAAYGQGPRVTTPAPYVDARGSLHRAVAREQREDATLDVNSITFSSLTPVDAFNEIGPATMLVAEFEGVRFAFATMRNFYVQSALYHYLGRAILPTHANLLVDSPLDFVNRQPVVSNSLPIWLAMAGSAPLGGVAMPTIQLFPSDLVPANLEPTYGSVHIPPEATTPLQLAPYLDANSSHWQLVKDRVEVTLYGLRNADALSFQDAVLAYSLATDAIGIMNRPVVRDAKNPQVEFGVIAMQKKIVFEVSYYQQAARDIARQLMLSCVPNIIVAEV